MSEKLFVGITNSGKSSYYTMITVNEEGKTQKGGESADFLELLSELIVDRHEDESNEIIITTAPEGLRNGVFELTQTDKNLLKELIYKEIKKRRL